MRKLAVNGFRLNTTEIRRETQSKMVEVFKRPQKGVLILNR